MQKAVIAFVPVLHIGYIDFFKQHPTQLFLLGTDFLSEWEDFFKEIRALKPHYMKKTIEALGIFEEVHILDRESFTALKGSDTLFFLPDEDISRHFAQRYLKDKEVVFEPVFLRWDKSITLKENEVFPGEEISRAKFDKRIMSEAKKEARKSSDWWRQIGAVLVRDKNILATAYNKHMPSEHSPYIDGDPRNNFKPGEHFELGTSIHAEASVIAQAASEGISTNGASIYTSVFPCPACAKLIVGAGITTVYYAQGYSLLDASRVFKAYNINTIRVV